MVVNGLYVLRFFSSQLFLVFKIACSSGTDRKTVKTKHVKKHLSYVEKTNITLEARRPGEVVSEQSRKLLLCCVYNRISKNCGHPGSWASTCELSLKNPKYLM